MSTPENQSAPAPNLNADEMLKKVELYTEETAQVKITPPFLTTPSPVALFVSMSSPRKTKGNQLHLNELSSKVASTSCYNSG